MARAGWMALLMLVALPAAADGRDVAAAAQAQVGVTRRYDPSYQSLKYPGGDVPQDRGVCTDVVVRALRAARGLDLQRLVHEDMKANFGKYPNQRRWRLSKPDPNIDHRRVPNLMTFFQRKGLGIAPSRVAVDYLPGDIVAWDLGQGLLHIGIVSDLGTAAGTPLIVHNIGAGVREEDILFRYTVIGHYRLPETGDIPVFGAGNR